MSTIHCWADKASQYEIGTEEWVDAVVNSATCLLPDGHDGPHEWTPDEEFEIEFADMEELCESQN